MLGEIQDVQQQVTNVTYYIFMILFGPLKAIMVGQIFNMCVLYMYVMNVIIC